MSVQRAIFPGLLVGIFCLIGFINLVLAPAGYHRLENQALNVEAVAPATVNEHQASEPKSVDCSISPEYPQSVRQWCGLIEKYSHENGLDPNLVSAVMLQESAGLPDAYSKSGAVGLLQVMPRDGKASKFMCKNGPCFSDRPTMEELFDPEYNVAYGARMLSKLIRRSGSVREALKAYGPMDVGYYYADLVIEIMKDHQ